MYMTHDPAHQEVVLFGGAYSSGHFDDTWTWDGSAWTEQHPVTSPPSECCSNMAYDAITQRVVLFGVGTWTWDGSNWTEEHPSTSPGARGFPAISSSGGHVVLNGGGLCGELCQYFSDTWSWSGITWVKRHPTAVPSARREAAMAYDVKTGQTVLFGGANENKAPYWFGDTWVWNGTNWTRLRPATSPSSRAGASVAYDATSGLLVLFGGEYTLADTWTWNGATWACVAGC
jgi:hypothetical protein